MSHLVLMHDSEESAGAVGAAARLEQGGHVEAGRLLGRRSSGLQQQRACGATMLRNATGGVAANEGGTRRKWLQGRREAHHARQHGEHR